MKIFKIIFFLATAFCFCLQYFGRILWGHKPIMNTNIDSAGDRRFGKRGDRRRRPPRKVRASSSFWRETFRSDTKFGRARTNVLCFFGFGEEEGGKMDVKWTISFFGAAGTAGRNSGQSAPIHHKQSGMERTNVKRSGPADHVAAAVAEFGPDVV